MAAPLAFRYDERMMAANRDDHITADLAKRRKPPAFTLWWRAARLRCPTCGRGAIFRGWFAMNEACPSCGRPFARDPGYLLGSIYFNYGVTALLVVVMYFTMFFRGWLSDGQRLVALSLFAVAFPMWFFRYARALWMAFDERWDPWDDAGNKEDRARSVEQPRANR
jgi:uncharacterized protein (DUF983 family)